MSCSCGFSTMYPNCNGTHSIVKAVKNEIIKDLQSWIEKNQGGLTPETVIDIIKKTKGSGNVK